MSLIDQARADLKSIMQDKNCAFGTDITVESPSGVTAPLVGRFSEIGAQEDPDTGQLIVSSQAHVSFALSDLTEAFNEIPEAVDFDDQKPWLVQYNSKWFRVTEPLIDEMLESAVFFLEDYDRAP